MAGVFWRDLETCIDLDKHSVSEVAEIIAGMTPTYHLAMCHAIRETFEHVNYPAEAAAIRELLA